MKRARKPEPTILDLVTTLLVKVRQQEAERMAVAIASTAERHRGGFMAHATATKHLGSLWGAVDAKGIRAEVEAVLGVRR